MSTTTAETIDDDRIVAKCYAELGDVTKEKGDYDESLRYHRKSMEIFERIDDTLGVADVHLNIAEIYKAKGEFKQAMSEYEKGLTLYEDVLIDEPSRNSDSGAENSLNSSSISDLQHSKQLSKSEEALPQTTLTDIIEKPSSNPLNDEINDIKDVLIIPTSLDDSVLLSSEKMINEPKKSLSSLSIPELLSSTTKNSLPYQTTPEESGILDKGASLLSPNTTTNLQVNSDDIDNHNHSTDLHKDSISNKTQQIDKSQRFWQRLPIKKLLIVILTIFFTGVLFWSLQNMSIDSLLSYSSNDSCAYKESPHTHDFDDLADQLGKILSWRKDRLRSLSQDNRRIIEDFLTNSDIRTRISVDKFQQLLDMLDLKIVLVPK